MALLALVGSLAGVEGAGAVSSGTAAPASTAAPQTPDDLTLWYDKPAADWETQALPIGNGALGAMVFGGVASEQIQFNEKSLWTGGPGSPGYDFGNWTTPRPNAIAEVQAQIDRDGRMTPEAVAAKLGQRKTGFGAYQTFGDLFLDFKDAPATPSDYRRELSLREAVARVGYTADGVRYSREYFASHPGDVVVGRVSADRPGKVSFTLRTTSPRQDRQVSVSGGRLTIKGALADNGMRFESQVQVLTKGGSRADAGDRITVTGADSAVFVLSAGTDYADTYPSYRGADPHAKVTAAVDKAARRGFERLKAAHQADYRALFDRVKLDIGQRAPAVPTDRLRAAYTGGASPDDRALEAMFFAYGRYLLISSSRAGSLPANLQGVWNNVVNPPWSADYHVNINLQMNYWLAEQTNLAETTGPYDRYVTSMVAPGRETAREMFGSRGWVVQNETNPFGFTGVHDWATSFWFPEAAAWLTQQMYDHYRFNGDVRYLRDTAYPVMKGAAEFWLDNLRPDPRDGKLVVTPSYSPEQGDFSAGASMSQQIVWEVLTHTLEAAGELDVDPALRAELRTALSKLDPGIRVGSWGQLQEWKSDWDDPNNDHRHVSHLYALHPGHQIAAGTPQAEAAKVSLTARGDGGTGWSKAWKINFWARLLDGDHSHKMLSEQLKSSTLDNLWDTHPPFQIDGNFGATSGVSEMLLQSQHDVVHVLPALPSAWPTGSVSGLRARGGVTVGATWRNAAADTVTLRAARTGTLKVRSSLITGRYRFTDDRGADVSATRDGDTLTWKAKAGRTYKLVNEVSVAISAPADAVPGTSFPVAVTVSATGGRSVPASTATLRLPTGWTGTPASIAVPSVRAGRSWSGTFTVTPGPADGSRGARLTAVVTGDGWTASGSAGVGLSPCAVPPADRPVVAWDPSSGATVDDVSGSGRHATVAGAAAYDAAYDAAAPTGSGLVLDGESHLATGSTLLGYLRQATFAAEVKVDGSGYRRLFDAQPSGNPGDDGVILDLTPSNNLRFIGAGVNITTDAVVPTGRYVDLVVTMETTGRVTVYVDGARAGGGNVTTDGITGCTSRPLLFAADQGGGQRLSGAVDRIAILPRALTAAEVPDWQAAVFGQG
ncbi:glycoside hydrolase N-terminal domain-containing protein [Sphaerisporangium sp. TRM90804]|uniref:glycosyl hydrolase family 95 catalytic domain-containing protein n=1 Tax=Sphaerisporangium sp. TRM90804 TaxID=3031113 RepID=UPI0024476BD5|nr:glycoside hydrolase N-terminal domain-containing protein [Sphaerisporangium sp. TRM90804]MDH2424900.1 glycoside hydrolase N-terminal domain-containing protein [Sphaerisporangium sp. TRM90804]